MQKESKIDWHNYVDLPEDRIEETVKEILAKMDLKEKANQMSGNTSFYIGILPLLRKYNPKPIIAGRDKKLGIPGIGFTDGPRGVVMNKSTCFPVSMARGATWDIELEEKIGDIIGIEARAQGANYFGGVCINLLRHPSWGRAQETYGEDPYHLGVMGSALIKGVQKHVMACAKHYACNSIENSRFKVDVRVDERTLREIYLAHFKMCVENGVASIMNAYNKVNGFYCGHNSHLLRDILKNDWGFKGFVITDFILGIRNGKKAVNAGVDIEMPFRMHMGPKKLIKLVKSGKIPEEYINEAAKRIIRQKLRFNKTWDPQFYSKEKVACKEHISIALEAARKSIVLLKNENSLLPLNRSKIKKIAVIGKLANKPNIGDHGSSRVYPPYVITPLEGIKKAAGDSIEIIYDNGENLNRVKRLVKKVDIVIIVVGYTNKDEGEYTMLVGGDRTKLELKPKSEDLILNIAEINKNVIVIIETGSAIIMEKWKNMIPAILMAWYPGMEGGTAIGEIIFGAINPSGKLPIIFPKSMEQLPFFDKKAKSIEYGYYHGYRLLDKNNDTPAFHFGFGLSYSSYSYKNLKVSNIVIDNEGAIKINIEVSNNGTIYGEEIVQIYVGYMNSSVDRPVKELKGFGKLKLKPGETKTFTYTLLLKDLAYYNVSEKKWKTEDIDYKLYVGSSSRKEDLLAIPFKIT
ncbi:MAG: beta-glucosidase family protein [Candidatus Helarchaeota archaeon]